jgi:hypothetical protein
MDRPPWWRRYSSDPVGRLTLDFRKPVPVNTLGHGTSTTYDKLTEEQKRRFDAQFAAWRAACDLAEVHTDSAAYGIPVPDGSSGTHNPIDAWLTARRAWERFR